MPKVIIESHIPYVPARFLVGIADVEILPPEEITRRAVADASALIVRTRTRCDAALLDGSAVRFIATATIGTDHIDIPYCREHGIMVVSAPGCNAPAVAQYVWASILTLLPGTWRGITLGIVGLGHVGSVVADWAVKFGVRVFACDPPRKVSQAGCGLAEGWSRSEPFAPGTEQFVSIEEIAREADVITFHTPHTTGGDFPTHHMAGERFFSMLERTPLVINAARGPIFDTEAILSAFDARKLRWSAVDCWEGEPALNGRLLRLSAVATPHIAGYSIEGKQRATNAALSALLDFMAGAIPEKASEISACRDSLLPAPPPLPAGLELTPEAVVASYDPVGDTCLLKENFSPEQFETLRNRYRLRHEVGF